MANQTVNFTALLRGLAEELNLPPPTYFPTQPHIPGTHSATCRFGNATSQGSGSTIAKARNASACIMWSNLGNGVRANPRYILHCDIQPNLASDKSLTHTNVRAV